MFFDGDWKPNGAALGVGPGARHDQQEQGSEAQAHDDLSGLIGRRSTRNMTASKKMEE